MKVLGIESSCDETAIAIVDENKNILSNLIVSQIDIHKVFGGVIPEIASRNHLDIIDKIIVKALQDAHLTWNDIDVIASATGPGLMGGLIVGALTGRMLASILNKPFIPINHLEGHLLTTRLTNNIHFPFLTFLISGGHTQILLAKDVGEYEKIGETIDDSLGECFDKVGQMLGLEYPAGPKIEQLAKNGDENKYKFIKPLINAVGKGKRDIHQYNFSFSGLKTALRIQIEKMGELKEQDRCDISASFQKTILDILQDRFKNVMSNYDLKGNFIENKIYSFCTYHKVKGKYLNMLYNNIKILLEQKPVLNSFYEKDNNFIGLNKNDTAKKVFNYYYKNNKEIYFEHKKLGKIRLTKQGLRGCFIHHSIFDKEKTQLYKHLPQIIENSVVINKEYNWKDREYNTYLLACVGEINGEEYIIESIVKEQQNRSREFYLHNVIKKTSRIETILLGDGRYPPNNTGLTTSLNSILITFLSNVNSFKEQQKKSLKNLVFAGGVASNQYIKNGMAEICKKHGLEVISPPLKLCTDNAVMIAWVGLERYKRNLYDKSKILTIKARWELD